MTTVLATTPARTEPLSQPQGDVILSVGGNIKQTNVDGRAVFDLAMLKQLPVRTFSTTTIWTEGANAFTGVLLKDLLDALGSSGTQIKATAINDYAVDIPASDAVEGGAIVAYEMNGKPMPVREKGPLWIVYPYDASPDYRTETIYSRSIWQLHQLDIAE